MKEEKKNARKLKAFKTQIISFLKLPTHKPTPVLLSL
jgi:hypothetical protein